MDYTIFNMRTDVNAFGCTRGCTDTVRGSALKVKSERKIPCHTGESNQTQRRAHPMLYQLSHVPAFDYVPAACRDTDFYVRDQKHVAQKRYSSSSKDDTQIREVLHIFLQMYGFTGLAKDIL